MVGGGWLLAVEFSLSAGGRPEIQLACGFGVPYTAEYAGFH